MFFQNHQCFIAVSLKAEKGFKNYRFYHKLTFNKQCFLNSNLAGRHFEIGHMGVSSRHRVVDKAERENGFQCSDIKGKVPD